MQAAINAGGTFLPTDLPNPPIYSKVNPADAPILTLALSGTTMPLYKVEDLADTTLAQKIAQLPGVGLVTISGGQKPAVRVQANPTALASYGLSLEDMRTALGGGQRGSGQGKHRRAAAGVHDRGQRSAILERRLQEGDHRLQEWRAGARVGCRQRYRRRREYRASRLVQRYAGGDCKHSAAAGRQHHQRGGPDRGAAAATAGFAAAFGIGLHSHRSHDHDSSFGQGCAVRVDADRGAGGHGHLPVPAQPGGHGHSQRRGARCRWWAPSARCTCWAIRWTIFR